jgi:hypothetical protein
LTYIHRKVDLILFSGLGNSKKKRKIHLIESWLSAWIDKLKEDLENFGAFCQRHGLKIDCNSIAIRKSSRAIPKSILVNEEKNIVRRTKNNVASRIGVD